MNDKTTEIDIAKRLTGYANVSESIASDFISTYFSLIREGLETDGVVKITGLGTFKLVLAESRKIINVQTKEDQEIPSHYRITFTPDKELAGRLNEPFSHLTTINLDEEDLHEESVELIASAAREYFDETIPEIPLPIHAPVMNKEIESYVVDAEPKPSLPEQTVTDVEESEPQLNVAHPVANKNSLSSLFVICITCALTLTLFAFFYFIFPDITGKGEVQIAPEMIPSGRTEPVIAAQSDSVPAKDTLMYAESEPVAEAAKEYAMLANETIRYGSRLTLLAQKYYGNKHFWCYIYEENKSHIANPNQIPVGTKVIIPHPSKYGIDASSAASVEKAKNYSGELNKRVYAD